MIINNLGKKNGANTIHYFAGQLFSKFHQNKLRNKRAGEDLDVENLWSHFLKTRNFGMALLCLQATISYCLQYLETIHNVFKVFH